MNEEKLVRTILWLIRFLVEKRYEELASLSMQGGLTSQQIQEAVETWPYSFVMPPSNALDDLVYGGAISINDKWSAMWSVFVNLWTKEEDRSDLTLETTMYDCSSEHYKVRLENIHVL